MKNFENVYNLTIYTSIFTQTFLENHTTLLILHKNIRVVKPISIKYKLILHGA